MSDYHFFMYWISFSALVVIAAALAFSWAFRAGHFKDQERAKHLALWAEMPQEEQQSKYATDEGRRTQNRLSS